MKPNLLRTNASILFVLTAASFTAFAKGRDGSQPLMTVRVLDYSGVSAGTRGELAAEATRVLSAAGIALSFIECHSSGVATGDPRCRGLLGPTDLVLRILPPKLAAKGTQLGYAAMTTAGGAYVTIFINPTQERARVGNLSNGLYLGHAVAHEIGHLLLGANSHSSSGIMRPAWRPVDEEWMLKRALLFDAGQAGRMQMALVRRLSP
jgi:hypothetical protein